MHRHPLSFLPVRSETTLPRPHSSKGQGRSPCGWEGPKAQKGCPSDIAFGPPAAQSHWRCVAAVPGDWSSKDLRDICGWPEGRWGSPFKTSAMWTRRPHVKHMLGGRSGPFSRGAGDRRFPLPPPCPPSPSPLRPGHPLNFSETASGATYDTKSLIPIFASHRLLVSLPEDASHFTCQKTMFMHKHGLGISAELVQDGVPTLKLEPLSPVSHRPHWL